MNKIILWSKKVAWFKLLAFRGVEGDLVLEEPVFDISDVRIVVPLFWMAFPRPRRQCKGFCQVLQLFDAVIDTRNVIITTSKPALLNTNVRITVAIDFHLKKRDEWLVEEIFAVRIEKLKARSCGVKAMVIVAQSVEALSKRVIV